MNITFCGALTLLFIGLKLGGAITWSWWLVLLPFYGPLALAAGFFVIAGILYLTMSKEQKQLYRAKKALENYAAALDRNRR